MSHPDSLYDPDNSEDDDMDYDFAQEVEDYNDYYIEENSVDDDDDYYDDMDGDHDSAMRDAGFGTDENYGYYGEDY